jgi:hypothetical protein
MPDENAQAQSFIGKVLSAVKIHAGQAVFTFSDGSEITIAADERWSDGPYLYVTVEERKYG